MDPQAQLETYLKQQPAERRQETLQRIFDCVAEILQDYRSQYERPLEALQAAVSDQQEYAREFGENRLARVVDGFVVQELYFKTLN